MRRLMRPCRQIRYLIALYVRKLRQVPPECHFCPSFKTRQQCYSCPSLKPKKAPTTH